MNESNLPLHYFVQEASGPIEEVNEKTYLERQSAAGVNLPEALSFLASTVRGLVTTTLEQAQKAKDVTDLLEAFPSFPLHFSQKPGGDQPLYVVDPRDVEWKVEPGAMGCFSQKEGHQLVVKSSDELRRLADKPDAMQFVPDPSSDGLLPSSGLHF